MRRIAAALFLAALAWAAPCPAVAQGGPVAVGQAVAATGPQGQPQVVLLPSPAQPAPPTIDTGTWAGDALIWVTTLGGGAVASLLSAWLVQLFRRAGVDLSDAARQRLQEIVVNGLNAGAAKAAKDLAGKGQIEIKNAAVAYAVTYAQEHGADVLKTLGLKPTSSEAVSAITARAETAIADPAVATAPVLAAPPLSPAGTIS